MNKRKQNARVSAYDPYRTVRDSWNLKWACFLPVHTFQKPAIVLRVIHPLIVRGVTVWDSYRFLGSLLKKVESLISLTPRETF